MLNCKKKQQKNFNSLLVGADSSGKNQIYLQKNVKKKVLFLIQKGSELRFLMKIQKNKFLKN